MVIVYMILFVYSRSSIDFANASSDYISVLSLLVLLRNRKLSGESEVIAAKLEIIPPIFF
jgi:hypothetical protein